MRNLLMIAGVAAMAAALPSLADAQGRGKAKGQTGVNVRGNVEAPDRWVRRPDGRWVRTPLAQRPAHPQPAGGLDHRPPFVGFRLLVRAQCFRCLAVRRRGLQAKDFGHALQQLALGGILGEPALQRQAGKLGSRGSAPKH
jgi:hypothetical protein